MKAFKNVLVGVIVFFTLSSCFTEKNKDHNVTISKGYYKNGKLEYIYWNTNNNEGKSYLFKKNGEKFAEIDLKNGVKEGKSITYYKNTILSIENYHNDKLDGEAKYYNNGKLEIEGYFKDDLKVGLWNCYHRNKLILSELYSNGKLQKIIYKEEKHFNEVNRIAPDSAKMSK